jgi:hypothetical protein
MADPAGAAFPSPHNHSVPGMSLRDYFASAAMQGLCAESVQIPAVAAVAAYRLADAMIEERSKQP